MELLTTYPEINDYTYVSNITTGAFAGGWKAMHKITQDFFAIQSVSKSSLAVSGLIKDFSSELFLAKKSDHKHIIGFIELIEDPQAYHLVYEYPPGVPLCDYIKEGNKATPETLKHLLVDLLDVLNYIHEQLSLRFSTVNTDNIFVDENCHLTRFFILGESSLSPQPTATSIAYLPPEVLTAQKPSAASDSWSLGVLSLHLLSGKLPFEGETPADVTRSVLRGRPCFNGAEGDLLKMVQRALIKNPLMRFALVDLVSSPFLKDAEELSNAHFGGPPSRRSSEADGHPESGSRPRTPLSTSAASGPLPPVGAKRMQISKLPSAASLAGMVDRPNVVRIGVRKSIVQGARIRPTTRTPQPDSFS